MDATNDLTIMNFGDTPTFERGDQTSYIDLIMSNQTISLKMENWMVLSNLESLSDNKYTRLEVSHRIYDAKTQKETARFSEILLKGKHLHS